MPLVLLLPLLLATETPVATCPAEPTPLPAVLAGWKPGAALTAGKSEQDIPHLTLGARADVTLRESSAVTYVRAPAKPAAAGSKSGLLAFFVAQAGTYRIALGTAAWIDVIGNGKSIASSAHDHGPACSGIRKLVDFALTPGAYVLQISGSAAGTTGVLVTRLP